MSCGSTLQDLPSPRLLKTSQEFRAGRVLGPCTDPNLFRGVSDTDPALHGVQIRKRGNSPFSQEVDLHWPLVGPSQLGDLIAIQPV